MVLTQANVTTDQFVIKNAIPELLKDMQNHGKMSANLNDNLLSNNILVRISL
jgi:hypothetical protein